MEPNYSELRELIALEAAARNFDASHSERLHRRPSGTGRALELAVAAIETLRDRGSLTGEELCQLAVLIGYDDVAVARAWNTRCEFDIDARPYAPGTPIARVLPLP